MSSLAPYVLKKVLCECVNGFCFYGLSYRIIKLNLKYNIELFSLAGRGRVMTGVGC